MTARVLAAVVMVLAGTAVAQRTPEPTADDFSVEERRRLEAGQLVTRRVSQRRGQLTLIGGSAWQVIDLPVEVTWRALRDRSAYTQMLPATEDAREISSRGDESVMRIQHVAGFVRAQYHLRMTFDDERRDVAFRLDRQRPGDLRAAWGFIQVQPYEGSATRSVVSFGVMLDPGGGMLGGMLRGQIHEWVLRVPATIRDYLHGPGAARY